METLSRHAITGGYQSSGNPLEMREGSIGPGSRNLLFLGEGRPVIYKGALLIAGQVGSRVMFNIPDGGHAGLGDAATLGIGSIVGLIARAFAFVGAGPLFINGVARGVSATTTPQMLLYRAGSYTGAGTGPYAMGLSRPGAPTIAETPNVNAEMNGTVAAVIWFVRSATGGRSRASVPSAVLAVNGKKVRITISAPDLATASANGYDRIGVGVTRFGFGFAGPFYGYKDANIDEEIPITSLTTVDGVANSYELSWTDGSLAGSDLAPIIDFPPPACAYLAALEDVMAYIGAHGDSTSGMTAAEPGTAVYSSLPVLIESVPPDNIQFLPEKPTGALSRAADGFAYVPGKNSLSALLYTGGKNPLSLRSIWPTVGFLYQHNMWLGEGGRLYGFSSGRRGLVRIGEDGEPETAWAADVAEETRSWAASGVVGGWDGDHQMNVVGHSQTLLCFTPAARNGLGAWGAPLNLAPFITGNLCACDTVSGALLLAASDGTTVRLYNFNAGTGAICEVFFPEVFAGDESANIFRLRIAVRPAAVSVIDVALFKNGSAVNCYLENLLPQRTGRQNLLTLRPNVRGAQRYQGYLRMLGTGSDDAGPDYMEILGELSGVVLGVAAG